MASTSSPTLSTFASTSSPTTWDVFISFRGIDTRYTFTDYLYDSLHRTAIRTFKDDPELRSGEVISDSLLQAIKESKTYIVVLSENYASSRWCLDELVEILGCCKSLGRLVVPVFYNIEPSAVRHQTGSFYEAFQTHNNCFDMDKLDMWRVTLKSIVNLSGYEVRKDMSQADIINKVVDRVLLEINPMTLDVAKYPVGLDSRVDDISTLMSSDTGGVIRIGIHGMGGVGKTTLAKAVYNRYYCSFQGSCFLANVREASGTTKGLVSLQKQLVNDVLKCRNINIDNVDQGIELIRARICSIKILIVIDDLDNAMPLDFLVGPFAPGSMLIITTRNEDVLDAMKVEAKYKVNELDDAESHQLFAHLAFGDNRISDPFKELAKEILSHAGGLPLALKVFGSNLLNQPEEGWRWFIHKLKRFSVDDVEKKLRISFDSLKLVDPVLQDIFLDIACFFIGQRKEEVVKVLETFYNFANHNIDLLKKRCLLTINSRDELGIHDLLRDMAWDIVRNNPPAEPEKRSRLWVSSDICDVLHSQKGTKAIEGIIHNYGNYKDGSKELSFATKTFRRMSKLRFLHLDRVNLTGSFEQTLENLRWLCWDWCPLKCLPSDFHPQKLVILELPHSKIRTMWELNKVSQVFKNLKTLNMSYSLDLTTTPDFTMIPSLETICFEGCESLEEIHISIGSLPRLVSLALAYCSNLRSLPDSICNLRALKILNIGNCNSLKALPAELGNIESLEELNAEGLNVCELPDSIGRLSKLVELNLRYSKNLETLPDSICNLRALEMLCIADCSSFRGLPMKLGNIQFLKKLNAEGLIVRTLPYSIGHLSKLVELRLSYNKNLKTLPDTICRLRSLEVLCIGYCSSLKALPIQLGKIVSLKELNAEGLTVRTLPDSIGLLSKLVYLRLSYNWNLETLPDAICNLKALKVLSIDYCSGLKALPIELGNIETLKELNAWGVTLSKLPDSIGRLSNLKLRHNNELSEQFSSMSSLVKMLRRPEEFQSSWNSKSRKRPQRKYLKKLLLNLRDY